MQITAAMQTVMTAANASPNNPPEVRDPDTTNSAPARLATLPSTTARVGGVCIHPHAIAPATKGAVA